MPSFSVTVLLEVKKSLLAVDSMDGMSNECLKTVLPIPQ